ncbi:glycosyltransferase [bacterium]|nr:glycosyltransferase [bacterium]
MVEMISFIVPAYNEERLLPATLASIHKAAESRPYEIIVVNDGSSDQTASIAEASGARVINVAHRQIAATRNSGARAAHGKIFIFVDADTLINETVVRKTVDAINSGAIGGGTSVKFDEPVPTYAKVLLPICLSIFKIGKFAGGCFIFCTREAFEIAGGFDETMYGAEEIEMSRALKRQGRFVILNEAVVTSGRKVRAHSGWKILLTFSHLLVRGPNSLRSRKGLELWYEDRAD